MCFQRNVFSGNDPRGNDPRENEILGISPRVNVPKPTGIIFHVILIYAPEVWENFLDSASLNFAISFGTILLNPKFGT
jgi:hypothetical protein